MGAARNFRWDGVERVERKRSAERGDGGGDRNGKCESRRQRHERASIGSLARPHAGQRERHNRTHQRCDEHCPDDHGDRIGEEPQRGDAAGKDRQEVVLPGRRPLAFTSAARRSRSSGCGCPSVLRSKVEVGPRSSTAARFHLPSIRANTVVGGAITRRANGERSLGS